MFNRLDRGCGSLVDMVQFPVGVSNTQFFCGLVPQQLRELLCGVKGILQWVDVVYHVLASLIE